MNFLRERGIKRMVSDIVEILKVLKEPMLLLLFGVICGLFYLLLKRERQCVNCVNSISGCNVSLTKLITLVEILFYKGGKSI